MKLLLLAVGLLALVGAAFADSGVTCGLCVAAVNELEGLAADGVTQDIMVEELKKLCNLLGNTTAIGEECLAIVPFVPFVVKAFEGEANVTEVCTDYLKLCSADIPPREDPSPMPGSPNSPYIVDLDAAPATRWAALCGEEQYKATLNALFVEADQYLPAVMKALNISGDVLLSLLPAEFQAELTGCAAAADIDAGMLAIMNFGYELSSMCTSIVIQTSNGTILHARNLDFGEGMVFTDYLRNLTVRALWQQSGNTLFETVQFIGFAGVLTGMKPGVFSASVNTRSLGETPIELMENIIAAIKNHTSSPTWLLRQTMIAATSFTEAVDMLAYSPVSSNLYFTVSGVQAGQGVVLARNRTTSVYQWWLNAAAGQWYQLIANYDQNEPQPWFDDRYTAAVDALQAAGQKAASFQLLKNVLGTKPVLNRMTTQTDWFSAQLGSLEGEVRYCNAPCPF